LFLPTLRDWAMQKRKESNIIERFKSYER